MLGILKLGLVPKLIIIAGIALGAGYLGLRVVSVDEPEVAPPVGATEAVPHDLEFFESIHARINSVSVFVRILIFLLIALSLPLITISLVRKILAHKSNAHNFAMLASYVLFDTLLALVLVGIMLVDFWAFFFVIVALAGSIAYNHILLNRIEELQQ